MQVVGAIGLISYLRLWSLGRMANKGCRFVLPRLAKNV